MKKQHLGTSVVATIVLQYKGCSEYKGPLQHPTLEKLQGHIARGYLHLIPECPFSKGRHGFLSYSPVPFPYCIQPLSVSTRRGINKLGPSTELSSDRH